MADPRDLLAAVSRRRALSLLGGLGAAGCFRLVGPEDPPAIETPVRVAVRIEYRQPLGCLRGGPSCTDPVIFFASWKQRGGEFPLQRLGDGNVWVGVAEAVPVNYPPRDEPYSVRVFDPFLVGGATGGITANRITVGGEFLTRFSNVGRNDESALVFVDEDGRGHNAF